LAPVPYVLQVIGFAAVPLLVIVIAEVQTSPRLTKTLSPDATTEFAFEKVANGVDVLVPLFASLPDVLR
jgi:hypothetical protein